MIFILCFITTLLVLLALIYSKLSSIGLDLPNHRSLHTVPVPRTGGLAIMAGVILGWYHFAGVNPLLIVVLLMTCLSLIDDFLGLSVRVRFVVQCILVAYFIVCLAPSMHVFFLIILYLSLIWLTNLYNFMDGSNGLAGGMSVFGFSTYALAAYYSNDLTLMGVSAVIAVCSVAFLIFNFHPAKIFMGDVGSIPIGFSAGAIGVVGWIHGSWPLLFPVFTFSPFIVDATVTLVKRLIRGEKIWQAHKTHYYQRLIQMGWGHRKTALYEYLLMLSVGLLALSLRSSSQTAWMYGACSMVFVYSVLLMKVDAMWRTYKVSNFIE